MTIICDSSLTPPRYVRMSAFTLVVDLLKIHFCQLPAFEIYKLKIALHVHCGLDEFILIDSSVVS